MAYSRGLRLRHSSRVSMAADSVIFVFSGPWHICSLPSHTAGRKSNARMPQLHCRAMLFSCVTPIFIIPLMPSPVAASCAPGTDTRDAARLSGRRLIQFSCAPRPTMLKKSVKKSVAAFILFLFANIMAFFGSTYSVRMIFLSVRFFCREIKEVLFANIVFLP